MTKGACEWERDVSAAPREIHNENLSQSVSRLRPRPDEAKVRLGMGHGAGELLDLLVLVFHEIG